MSEVEIYEIKFKNPYIINNEFFDIVFEYSDVFSLFRSCDNNEKGFYENIKDVCLKRFYEIFCLLNKNFNKVKTEEFYFATYFQEVKQWYEIIKKPEKNDMDINDKLKLDYTNLLNELNDYFIQKQFTNYSETNMIIGLGEQYFFKSDINAKIILLKYFKNVFEYSNCDLRDLAFYNNGKSFISVNTHENYINFYDNKDESNFYYQILEKLKKLDGMQITSSFTVSDAEISLYLNY